MPPCRTWSSALYLVLQQLRFLSSHDRLPCRRRGHNSLTAKGKSLLSGVRTGAAFLVFVLGPSNPRTCVVSVAASVQVPALVQSLGSASSCHSLLVGQSSPSAFIRAFSLPEMPRPFLGRRAPCARRKDSRCSCCLRVNRSRTVRAFGLAGRPFNRAGSSFRGRAFASGGGFSSPPGG